MKICIVGLRGIPGVMGGVETHCEELLPRVASANPDWAITVAGRAPYLPAKPEMFGQIRVVPCPSTANRSLEAILGTLTGILLAARERSRIVHIHAIGPALLTPFARLLGMKTVVTHHGADYNREKWGAVASSMLRWGEALGMKFAHRIIAVSPSLAETLKQKFPAHAEKISYIPNGAPAFGTTTGDASDIFEQLGIDRGEYLLTVGRLVPEKAFDTLVRAHRLSGSGRKLVIVGGADHESAFARNLREEADDTVLFAGVQPRSVLSHLYANARLFILPSFHEGLPICALEATQSGCNSLLSDIPANLDIGLSPGHYFPVGNEEALAEALSRPAESFAVDAEAIKRRFNWDEIAAQTASVYAGILCPAR